MNKRRAGAIAILVGLLSALLVLAAPSPAQAEGFGRMTGRIRTAGQPNQPCASPTALIYLEGGGLLSAQGTSDGRYVVESVPAGDHMVVLSCGGDWVIQTFRGRPGFDFGGFEPVHIIDGITTSEINAVLQPGGSVSGTITGSHGTFPQNCDAGAWVVGPDGIIQTYGDCSDPGTGAYLVRGAPKGHPYVQFFASLPYGWQWWRNAGDMASAKTVKVDLATTTPGIDARLRAAPPPVRTGAASHTPVTLPNGMVVPSS